MSSKYLKVYIINIAHLPKKTLPFLSTIRKMGDSFMLRIAFILRSMINDHLENRMCI